MICGCRALDGGLWRQRIRVTGADAAIDASRSEHRQATEMLCVYLLVSHIGDEADGTDSAMRRCVPQPSASAPAHYHVSYCASPAEARFDEHAGHCECTRRRKLVLLASCPGDSAAGNLYGTATYGGQFGYGTVFKLVHSSGGYTFQLLYTFTKWRPAARRCRARQRRESLRRQRRGRRDFQDHAFRDLHADRSNPGRTTGADHDGRCGHYLRHDLCRGHE